MVPGTIFGDFCAELGSGGIEAGLGWLGETKEDSIVDSLDYGSDAFGSHDVVGCVGAGTIYAC
jgi:hypothetical protein